MKQKLFLLLSISLLTASNVITVDEVIRPRIDVSTMPDDAVQKNNQLMYEKSEALNTKNNSYNITNLHEGTTSSWFPSVSMKDGITWPETKTLADGTKVTVHKSWSGVPVKTIVVHPANTGGLKINSSTEITHNNNGTHSITNTVSSKGYNTTQSTGTYQNDSNNGLLGHVSEKKYIDNKTGITTISTHDASGKLASRNTINKNGDAYLGESFDAKDVNPSDRLRDGSHIKHNTAKDSVSSKESYNKDGSYTKTVVSMNTFDPTYTVYHADSKQSFDQGKIQSQIQNKYTDYDYVRSNNQLALVKEFKKPIQTAHMFDSTKPYNDPDNQKNKIVQEVQGSTITTFMPTGNPEAPVMVQKESIQPGKSLMNSLNHQPVVTQKVVTQPQ